MKVNDLLNIAFEVSELNRDLALSKSRQKDYVKIRQLILFFAYHQFKHYSLSKIGDILGKDHGTVIYSVRQIDYLELQNWQPYLGWKIEIQEKINLFYTHKLDIKVCKYSQVFKI